MRKSKRWMAVSMVDVYKRQGRLGLGDNRETGRRSIKARGTDIANHMRRQYNSIAVQPYPAPVRNRGDTE